MNSTNEHIMVTVRCRTYNHENYIRDCLEGFVMQKTKFRFEVLVHDDASTDKTASIVKEYAEKYPNIIVPILEKENQYSKHDGTIERIFLSMSHGKYIAACEGDDCWTDPLKLQKQVDFLEAHPDYTMVCNRTQLYSEKVHKAIGENYCYNQSQPVDVRDVICRGGMFISTCSIIYRANLKDNYPDYCRKCKVGDFPLQIMAAMKGNIYYFNDMMSVYRTDNPMSWMGGLGWTEENYEKRISAIRSVVSMLKGFSTDYPQYSNYFKNRIAHHINLFIPNRKKSKKIRTQFYEEFKDEFKSFSFLWKLDAIVGFSKLPLLIRIRKLYYPRISKKIYLYSK